MLGMTRSFTLILKQQKSSVKIAGVLDISSYQVLIELYDCSNETTSIYGKLNKDCNIVNKNVLRTEKKLFIQ